MHLKTRDAAAGSDLGQLQLQALLQDYLRLRKALYDIQRQFDTYTSRMSDWFERAGIEQFQTAFGVLERIRGDDGKHGFTLRS